MKVKMFVSIFMFSVFLMGCGATRSDIKGPYTNKYVSDPALYNVIYNDIFQTLSSYMGWKLNMISSNEVALILEIDDSLMNVKPAELVFLNVINGWMVLEDSNIMLTASQLDSLTSMSVDNDLTGLPTAKFYVSMAEKSARVYIYYWLVEKFAYTHSSTYTKTLTGWVRTEELVVSGTKF